MKKQQYDFTAKPVGAVCWVPADSMTPVAAGNTNLVTLISYSFVCLGP